VAFFEIEGASTFAKGAGSPPPDHPVQLDHISLNLADAEAIDQLRARLVAAGSEVTEVVDHGMVRSVYFTDPNGIALEASYWVDDPTGRAPQVDNPELFGDPDPTPSVAELADGNISSLPRTELV